MTMEKWIAVREAVPWLPPPPYLVDAGQAAKLRNELRRAGFKVFEADAGARTDERGLLLAIGDALAFPDYYGANWAAFEDCLGDLLRDDAGHVALLIVGADTLMRTDLHTFVRAVHLLQDAVSEVERAQPGHFQFEVFHVGEFARGHDSPAP